jgi:hypothetical protein
VLAAGTKVRGPDGAPYTVLSASFYRPDKRVGYLLRATDGRVMRYSRPDTDPELEVIS